MSFSETDCRPDEQTNNRILTWYLICRTAVITFLLGGAGALYLKGDSGYAISPLLFLIATSYVEALLSAALINRISRLHLFSQIQIAWDLIFVTALILLTGGVESVFSFAYLLVIVSASFLLSRRLTILAAAASVVLFGGILDLQYFNYLDFIGLTQSVAEETFFSTLFVHAVAFFLAAILSGTLAERWRTSEERLQQKTIDFAELEKMNKTILEHINSGLMLVALDGTIKTFNRAAADITGLSLEDVYGRLALRLFPDLFDSDFAEDTPRNRSEGSFVAQNGREIILGYATTPARGSDGERIGTLVTFQDLTQLKKIEEDLKRIDRLAAVGRLAASMAHEIRNPLASISGSVQLLLENSQVQDEDRNLMNIVVNEADRLNDLLTNFLHFARPKAPKKSSVDMASLVDELFVLLKADLRFRAVQLLKECPDAMAVNADRQQIQKVLWDLSINACEAMNGDGILRVRVVESEASTVIVEDSGPGVPDAEKNRIFEPFFSTKDNGTGLGLASVHSVMEAHGGSVALSRSDLGGACFILNFPR